MDLTTARAFLQRKEGGSGGGSVYDHLTDLVVKLLNEQPSDGLAAFEQLSARVKAGALSLSNESSNSSSNLGAAASAEDAALRSVRLNKSVALCTGGPVTTVRGEEEEEASHTPTLGEPVQDLLSDAAMLEWGGFSLGRTETFRLYLSLRSLASSKPVKSLRLWGKLLGLQADYIVAEGFMEPGDIPGAEAEADEDRDGLGNAIQRSGVPGPNEKVYFVCSAIGDPWTLLPRVTPHQVIAARRLRRFLTGDLAAPVGGHPPFPGREANLLRATIELISAATAIAPSGAYVAVEGSEDGGISANAEEWAAPDLKEASAWVHTALELNSLGRTLPNPPQPSADGEDAPPDPDAPAPSQPLKPISDDTWPPTGAAAGEGEASGDYALVTSSSAWDLRTVPVAGLGLTPEPGQDPWSVSVLRSLAYPGALAVGCGKKSACVYCGYGLPSAPVGTDGRSAYQPSLPPSIPAEYDYSGAVEGQQLAEQGEVTSDPNAGKAAAGEGEEEGEEEA